MPTNLSKDLSLESKNPAIANNEGEVNHDLVLAANRRQIRVLYAIKFLNSMSLSLNTLTLYSIFKEVKNVEITEFNSYLDSLKPSHTIVQAISNIGFGLISDRFGRKPALNALLLGSGISMGLFGFNKNLTTFSLFCTLNSAFNCNRDIIKSMTVELSDKYLRPSALAHLNYVELIAVSVGGMLGGCINFQFFTESEFNSNDNPTFALFTLIPCLISASINGAAYMLSRYYLNETPYENTDNLNLKNIKSESKENLDKFSNTEQSTLFGLRLSENSKLILIGSSLAALTHNWFLSTKLYWFGMMETEDGINFIMENAYLSLLRFITMIGAQIMYPYIIKKFGSLKVYRSLFPVTSVIFPIYSILTHFAKIRYNHIVFIPLTILFSTQLGICYLYDTSSDLLLAESSEATKNLGTLYGISSALCCISDLVTKQIFSAIQAISFYNTLPSLLNYNNLNWGLLTTLSLTGYWLSSKIKNF